MPSRSDFSSTEVINEMKKSSAMTQRDKIASSKVIVRARFFVQLMVILIYYFNVAGTLCLCSCNGKYEETRLTENNLIGQFRILCQILVLHKMSLYMAVYYFIIILSK
jgi:UDP-glucose 4-epimerase